jgi:glycosyltransferase involved in cell wall biosynthesis
VPKNGVNVAVDAARLLRDRGVEFVLLIAGYGPMRKELDSQVRSAGLENHVRFLGAVSTSEMPGWCARATVVVVPSVPSKGVEEATSISAIEGQAVGRPVVASDLGGLREVITNDVNGLLSPPGNAEPLPTPCSACCRTARWRRGWATEVQRTSVRPTRSKSGHGASRKCSTRPRTR